MSIAIDDDTYQAVVNLWTSPNAPGANDLAAILPEPIRAGRLVPKKFPYAQVEIKKGKDNQRMTGGVYHDFRDVTITVVGQKADVTKALTILVGDKKTYAGIYTLKLGTTGNPTLTLPSGDLFRRWWPQNDGELIEDETTKEGKDVWRGVVKGEVWSVRTD